MLIRNYMEISPEVKKAISQGKPVVALESTIISHGMPYPMNAEVANKVENVVRSEGVVPATIAIIRGKIKVGLTPDDIEYLAKTGRAVNKVSHRDIPVVLAKGEDGATTVAGTMYIAAMAGIKVFVTGGIGGVHKKAQQTWDVSCDLTELSKTPVMVVCAGAKSILDLGLTKEYLETMGVPLLGYKTEVLPAFYSSVSDYTVDRSVDTPKELAKIYALGRLLGLQNGYVVANPVPEEYSIPGYELEKIIFSAVQEAEVKQVKGKDITPYLLQRIVDKTAGRSLEANIALVLNNAKLGSQIAKELQRL